MVDATVAGAALPSAGSAAVRSGRDREAVRCRAGGQGPGPAAREGGGAGLCLGRCPSAITVLPDHLPVTASLYRARSSISLCFGVVEVRHRAQRVLGLRRAGSTGGEPLRPVCVGVEQRTKGLPPQLSGVEQRLLGRSAPQPVLGVGVEQSLFLLQCSPWCLPRPVQ